MDALRVELLNQHLITLLKGEEVETPIFNFKMGKPELKGKKMKLPKRAPVLILEGIHCLNPSLTPVCYNFGDNNIVEHSHASKVQDIYCPIDAIECFRIQFHF